jgi:hypothetical protein
MNFTTYGSEEADPVPSQTRRKHNGVDVLRRVSGTKIIADTMTVKSPVFSWVT